MIICGYCDEEITPQDIAVNQGLPLHQECHLRLIIGSLAHQRRRCSCFVPGSTEDDPPHMTKRQAARAAVNYRMFMQARN